MYQIGIEISKPIKKNINMGVFFLFSSDKFISLLDLSVDLA